MKFIVFVALLFIAVADSTDQAAYSQINYPPQPYSYSYNVQDEESNNDYIHQESADGRVTTGSYRVSLPDGRTQFVTYRADENGYTANVEYEGEAHHPDGYIAPPTAPFKTPVSQAIPYSASAASNHKAREAPAFKEASITAAPTSVIKTREAPASKESAPASPKTRDAPNYKESSTVSYKDSVSTYSPPSPPTHNPPAPPSHQTHNTPPYQGPVYRPPAYRVVSPVPNKAPSPPSHRSPAPASNGFTPIGPTPLAYRG